MENTLTLCHVCQLKRQDLKAKKAIVIKRTLTTVFN